MSEYVEPIDIQEFDDYTGKPEYSAVYTITLAELVNSGVFSWEHDYLDWRSAAYDSAQYERVCSYFIERFRYREISMVPFKEWALMVRRKLVYELMPKYRPLYERVAEGLNPLQNENEYYKNRTIDSSYPETLLSENADYITDGRDEEFQRIKENNLVDSMQNYAGFFRNVDEMLLDDLESMFICMYTTNINGSW